VKRHQALQELSRDHHQALVVAQRLRRAGEAEATAARDEFLAFWREDGAAHFQAEESVLLPRFATSGGFSQEVVGRVLLDHAEIRLIALRLQAGQSEPELLQQLGECLSAHVRVEERVLFPAIEAALSEEALVEMARELDR
jgi:hemerythrin-like domain-containing protein